MILYPAIDLKDGACVRLLRGDMACATVFNADPAAQARAFTAAGAPWLHVVDLDGARAGTSVNAAAVTAILEATSIPVQLGGGIRSVAQAARWLERGVARVVLGTAAVKTPAVMEEACRAFPGRIAVGIDTRGGRVAVSGWAETAALDALTMAQRAEQAGAAAVIYTLIERDGAMAGPDAAALAALAHAISTPVIASGGVSNIADLQRLRDSGILAGVIVGRALYDGSLTVRDALRAVGDSGQVALPA